MTNYDVPIIHLIDAFVEQYPAAESGPAHIVLGDYNLDDYNIGWCMGQIDYLLEDLRRSNGLDSELEATRAFLVKLYSEYAEEREAWQATWNP